VAGCPTLNVAHFIGETKTLSVEFIAGDTLHGLAESARHLGNLIRIWVKNL
jgi:hypothetical protein